MANANTESLLKISFCPIYQAGRKADSTKVDSSIRFHYFVSSSKEYGAGIADLIHFNCKWYNRRNRLRLASCFWHFFRNTFRNSNGERSKRFFLFFDESLDIVFSWFSSAFIRHIIPSISIFSIVSKDPQSIRGICI